MKRSQLFPSVVTFFAGLALGGLAFGDRDATPVDDRSPTAATDASGAPPSALAIDDSTPPTADPVSATAGSPAATAEDGVTEVEIGPMSLDEQMQVMISRWAELERRLNGLGDRLASLEREQVTLQAVAEAPRRDERPVLPTDTPENRKTALIAAGVAEPDADDIVVRQSALELDRLELQDLAMREGWFRSERYYRELRGLNADGIDLRAEIGDESYDRYLYETGETNRVKVSSVIQGSQAEQSGLMVGDIIERYGEQQILDFSDLRGATTAGSRDELVPVQVRRGDSRFEAWIPRGPIGVRLEAASAEPGV